MGMTVTKYPWLNIGEEACKESWRLVLEENKLPGKAKDGSMSLECSSLLFLLLISAECLRRADEDEWESVVLQWLKPRNYGEVVRGPVCSHKPGDLMGEYTIVTVKYTSQLASGDTHYKVRILASATTMRLHQANLTTSHY